VTDTTPSTVGHVLGTGAGPSFQAMSYEVGLKKGDNTPKRKRG
jgi:hypothetical protein